MEIKEKDLIYADRHSDLTFTDCLVIECTNEYSSLDIGKYILQIQSTTKRLEEMEKDGIRPYAISQINELEQDVIYHQNNFSDVLKELRTERTTSGNLRKQLAKFMSHDKLCCPCINNIKDEIATDEISLPITENTYKALEQLKIKDLEKAGYTVTKDIK